MTSTAYYPTIKWYYYNATGAAWVDISGYVLTKQGVSGHWGMRSNKYTDRLAATGEMRMLLDNTDGVFDPDDASALTGWAINTKVKMVVTFDGVDYVRFMGTVESLKFSDPSTYEHTCNARVVDFMGYLYKYPLTERSIETYKRGGYLSGVVVGDTGQTPQATNYAVGDYEFPAAFDSVTTTTKAATELNKIVLSENGYFYNRHDKVNGETLVFEAESTRNGLRTVSKLPVLAADCGDILKAGSATDHVLLAGSATDKLVLNETQDAHINGTAQRYERTHGENILNKVTVTAYPKRVDTEEQTIYSLGTPLMLAPGETKTINVKYQNVTTKESCNAITELCSQPVATTDYLMNRNKAGTSTNLTTSLTVSVVFKTATADVTLTSSSAYVGYVTRLYLKGYGVYQDSSIKAMAEDSTSKTAYGAQELNIEQQYQRDAAAGNILANRIIFVDKDPRTKLEKVTLIANKSDVNMFAFLSIDIGDMVKVTESTLNLADYYYVNGIDFNVAEGNVITYSWVLGETLPSVANGKLTPIALEFNYDYGAVDFGNIVRLTDPSAITMIFDINVYKYHFLSNIFGKHTVDLGDGEGTNYDWIGWTVNDSDFQSFHTGNTKSKIDFPSGVGSSQRVAISVPDAHNINKTPSVFVDGVKQSEEFTMEAGATIEGNTNAYYGDNGLAFTIGGKKSFSLVAPPTYGWSFEGKISRLLLYNVDLTDEEIVNDYSGVICDRGLVFYGPMVPTALLDNYVDKTLTSNEIIYSDGIMHIGIPQNEDVIGRSIT